MRYWQPGLPENESMRRIERELGLRLPVEARVWFAWHHGTVDVIEIAERYSDHFIPGYSLLSIDQCTRDYGTWTQVQESIQYDLIWDRNWLPIAKDSGGWVFAVDCSVGEGEPTPVRQVIAYDPDNTPATASLTDAVAYWVSLFEDGTWRWDPEAGRWATAYKRMDDPRVRIRRLH